MSLTDSRRKYAGHDMPDVATLVADGIDYRCTVYLNRAEWTIEAVCHAIQPDGSSVVIFNNTIAAATSAEITDTQNLPLDNPKIIAVGTTFVVHWLQAVDTVLVGELSWRGWRLYRATMDMTAFDAVSWTDRASTNIHPDGLYDVCPVPESTTDFVVARRTGDEETNVVRYFDWGWFDDVWTVQRDLTPNRTLGVYASDTDNAVLISYEAVAGGLYTTRYDADDGGNVATSLTFAENITGNTAAYVQVTHVRTAEDTVAVVAEGIEYTLLAAEYWMHHVIYREVSSVDATNEGNWHGAYHYSLCSRAWTWTSGTTVGNIGSVYVLLSYRCAHDPYEWEQSYQYVANLDLDLWGQVESGMGLRPRIISTITSLGIPDGRSSGWAPDPGVFAAVVHTGGPTKRMNHLSSAAQGQSAGAGVKTKVVATSVFAAAAYPKQSNTQIFAKSPINAGVFALTVHMEEPWAVYADPSLAEQPLENYRGVTSRPMCQPLEVARSTVFGGGTLHSYDGRRIVELGFPWRPEIIDAVGVDTGTSPTRAHDLMYNETYYAYAVYSWRDRAGQIHRSGPSPVYTFTTGASEDAVIWRIRTMTGSLKDAEGHMPETDSISIQIYRTTTGGTVYYNVFSATEAEYADGDYSEANTPRNNPETRYIEVYDGRADAYMISSNNAGPYQLGTAAPIVPPAMSVVTSWQNRIWGADALDPAVLWYSDEVLPDFGSASQFYTAPEFLATSFFRLGEIGEVTGLAGMDNALIIFTARAIYALMTVDAGGGLLNVQTQVISETTGCIEPRSIALGPPGLFFQSHKGYYLLTRDRALDYMGAGAGVEDLVRESGNVRAASVARDKTQLRVVCNGRPTNDQTWTLLYEPDPENTVEGGTWTVTGLGVTISYVGQEGDDINDVVSELAGQINALLLTTLEGVVSSALAVNDELVLRLAPGVSLTVDGTGPTEATVTPTSTSRLVVHPRVLVFDYFFGSWTTADLVPPVSGSRLGEVVDGLHWGGLGYDAHAVLAQGALLLQQDPDGATPWTDQNSVGDLAIPIDVRTSWLHLAGIAGYQRVWEIGLTARKPNASAFSFDLDYVLDGDYDNPVHEVGLATDYPSPAYTRLRPSIQKASAVRVRIYEESGIPSFENLRLTSLIFKVGVKRGPNRVANTQIAGA
jgi:hypothetical protein